MKNKFGIIVSLERYIDNMVGLKPVKYANNDALAIKKLFIRKFDIPEDNILELCNEKCTYLNCNKNGDLAYYMSRLEEETTVYFYYVGHGFFHAGDNYLTVYDTSSMDLVATSISFHHVFMDLFRKSKASRLIAFIDACAEGLGENVRTIHVRGFDFKGFCGEDSFDYAVFFSCSPKEKSYSSDDLKQGVWTYFLTEAFGENGMEALSENGEITAGSLQQYLQNRVSEYVAEKFDKKTQKPYAVIASNHDMLLIGANDEISFEKKILMFDEELNNKCYLVNLYKGDYEKDSVFEGCAVKEEICWGISEQLPDDWHTVLNNLMYYSNRIHEGKSIGISFAEQKDMEAKIKKFLDSISVDEKDYY